MNQYLWSTLKRKSGLTLSQLQQHWQQHMRVSGRIDWHVPVHASHDDSEIEHESDVLVAPPQLQRPPRYAVIILNDDYTPMEFVIEVLQSFFAMDIDRATQVMLSVHHQGSGVAGIYPRDIAETKANQVNQYARAQGHPLLCQIEPQP